MDYGAAAERLMAMDDAAWRRHANPWSVWTRLAATPLLFVALWSPFWIGWAGALPIAAAALWTWINPRLFPPPGRFDRWASKGVLGERVWLNRKAVPIPAGYARAANVTTAISALFMVGVAFAFFTRNFAAGFLAWHAAVLAKLWFVDRMARLWEIMKDADPRYAAWAVPVADAR
ncbi:MAG: DUF6653 family protein [Pseudomonadota bacterium]